MKTDNHSGASEVVGAIILIAVIGTVVSIAGVAILSQPQPEKIPALNAEIDFIGGNTVMITHNGGDALQKDQMKIMVDGVDRTSSFVLMDGNDWSSWMIGDTLIYTGDSVLPGSIQIVYTGLSSGRVLQSWGEDAYAADTSTVTPTATTTAPVTTTTTPVPPLPVTADFSGSPLTGTAPLAVQFTDASNGPVTSWSWVFGDGNTSSVQNPVYTYPDAGVYPVSLTVSNGTGSSMLTKTGYISVSAPSSGAIYLNAAKEAYIESGGEIQFRYTGATTTITVSSASYTINNGDMIRLVLESNEYSTISQSSTSINSLTLPDVSFYQNDVYMTRGAANNLYISSYDQYLSTMNLFMPSASGWTQFSDDGRVTYVINGQSTAAIRITGLSGAFQLTADSSTAYFSGSASGYQILNPQVISITPNSGEAGTTVSITNLSGLYFDTGSTPTVKLQKGSSTIIATSINVLSSSQIQCTFSLMGAETGQWDVIVVNSDGLTGTGSGLFTVTPGPLTASFIFTKPSDTIVHFTDTSTGGATTWDWDFGDGTSHATVQNPPDHTYVSAGTYAVTLTVTDGSQSSSTQQFIPIFIPATHTATLNAGKAAYVELGGIMQFRYTGATTTMTVNGEPYSINNGDTIRLVMGSNEDASISQTSTRINSLTIPDVSFYQNDVYKNRGPVNNLYISSLDQYQSTMNLYMPSSSAWTSFIFDGGTLISGTSSSAVRITGLSGSLQLTASSSTVYYVGGATGYTIY